MKPPKSNKVIITRPYSPSFDTDISKTFERIKKSMTADKRKSQNVVTIKKNSRRK